MLTHLDRRALLVGGLALTASSVLAQPGSGLVRVALKTGQGVITLDLNIAKAPITAGHFLRYVDAHAYDEGRIYRAARAPAAPGVSDAPLTGVIQGGIRKDATLLRPIAHESTLKTGLSHKDGAISLGRNAPGTANSDFFICVGDQTYLDADPTAKGDNLGFAVFGQVVEGMDHVRAILALPTSSTAGHGAMKGEMLSPPVPIISARRAPAAS